MKGRFVTSEETNTVYFAVSDLPPVVSEVKVSDTHIIDAQSEVILPVSFSQCAPQPVIDLLKATTDWTLRAWTLL